MELDLKDLLLLLWQKIYWIISCAIIGGVIAFLVSYFLMTPKFSATASLYVYNNNKANITNTITQGDLIASQQLVETYIVIVRSDSVLEKVIQRTGYHYTPDEIRDMLSASSTNSTEAFSITIENEDPLVAKNIVNTIVEVIQEEIVRIIKVGSVEIIDSAKLPEKPTSPQIPMNTAVGILLGFALCAIIIVIRSLFDTTIHSEDDLAEFNIPILGVIPALDSEPSVR